MGWVVKQPMRSDFCGSPPCPICFDWADDAGVTPGLAKFSDDMLGRQPESDEERTKLREAAESVHAEKIRRKETPPTDLGPVNRFLKMRGKEQAKLKPVVKRQKVLDHIDLTESENARQDMRAIEQAEKAAAEQLEQMQAQRYRQYDYQRQMVEERDRLMMQQYVARWYMDPIKLEDPSKPRNMDYLKLDKPIKYR